MGVVSEQTVAYYGSPPTFVEYLLFVILCVAFYHNMQNTPYVS
ncbi:hypothetical protein J2750_001039 [Methanococcoides alaskense]|uniref:Uncharacterized protein n=1 Tax=Methanococcoides alaskense TaxID=325778 RepID=A0AA90TZU2_9EURY|nr:hypothetical protein [Methanococcoides alaskense]